MFTKENNRRREAVSGFALLLKSDPRDLTSQNGCGRLRKSQTVGIFLGNILVFWIGGCLWEVVIRGG